MSGFAVAAGEPDASQPAQGPHLQVVGAQPVAEVAADADIIELDEVRPQSSPADDEGVIVAW